MSVQITDDSHVALFDSVTGLPLEVAVFEDTDQAGDFLLFLAANGHTNPFLPAEVLEEVRERWWTERVESDGSLRA